MTSTVFDFFVDQQKAWFAEQQRTMERFWNIPRIVEQAKQTQVGQTPHDVVFQMGGIKLLRYRRETPAVYTEPVLMCYALVNRPYILDLQDDKSVVRQYLARGFDVYLIDWGVPTDADCRLRIEDYVSDFLLKVFDFIQKKHDLDCLNLLGYCMGGTLSTIFTALYPERVKTLTLLAAPIDFTEGSSLLNLWTGSKNFDVDALVDAFGNCPGQFLQGCFLMLKPVQSFLEKGMTFYDQMNDPRFVTNYFAMEQWVNDNIPVAGETFREFVKKLYQGNQLVKGEFHLGGNRVDLNRIVCPLLLLTAKNDHLVNPQSTEGIMAHVGSRDVHSISIDAGHVGLVVSGKAQKSLWPDATAWLGERSSKTKNPGTPFSASTIGTSFQNEQK